MNAQCIRFSQFAIPKGHTGCGPSAKTVVREKGEFLAQSAQLAVQSWPRIIIIRILLSLAGAATSIIFVATKHAFFVATNILDKSKLGAKMFCRDKLT